MAHAAPRSWSPLRASRFISVLMLIVHLLSHGGVSGIVQVPAGSPASCPDGCSISAGPSRTGNAGPRARGRARARLDARQPLVQSVAPGTANRGETRRDGTAADSPRGDPIEADQMAWRPHASTLRAASTGACSRTFVATATRIVAASARSTMTDEPSRSSGHPPLPHAPAAKATPVLRSSFWRSPTGDGATLHHDIVTLRPHFRITLAAQVAEKLTRPGRSPLIRTTIT